MKNLLLCLVAFLFLNTNLYSATTPQDDLMKAIQNNDVSAAKDALERGAKASAGSMLKASFLDEPEAMIRLLIEHGGRTYVDGTEYPLANALRASERTGKLQVETYKMLLQDLSEANIVAVFESMIRDYSVDLLAGDDAHVKKINDMHQKQVDWFMSLPNISFYYDEMLSVVLATGDIWALEVLLARGSEKDLEEWKSTTLYDLNNLKKNGLGESYSFAASDEYAKKLDALISHLKGESALDYGVEKSSAGGYKDILADMKNSALKGLSLEQAIKNNPDIYSTDNVYDLLTAAAGLKTIAQAQDYVSKVQAIMAIKEGKVKGFSFVLFTAERVLMNRLYSAFLEKLLALKDSKGLELDKILIDRISDFLEAVKSYPNEVSEDGPGMDYQGRDLVEDAIAGDSSINGLIDYFLNDKNGKVDTAEESALLFGTPENEFKDGLLYLVTLSDEFRGETSTWLESADMIRVLVLCNNDQITTSKGEKKDLVKFLTNDYAVTDANGEQKSLVMEKYAFGSIKESEFKKESLPIFTIDAEEMSDLMTRTGLTPEKLTKGLEVFKNLKSITK